MKELQTADVQEKHMRQTGELQQQGERIPQGRDSVSLLAHLEDIHTTELGVERIRRNLSLDLTEAPEVEAWCREKIRAAEAVITRQGKNWYIEVEGCRITVNAYSYTIITAHKVK